MLLRCSIHGMTPALRCSGDMHPNAKGTSEVGDIIDLVYVVEGDVAWAYYVSKAFAFEHRLKAGVHYDEEPGAWRKMCVSCCAKCFEEAHHGYIDESDRWHSKLSKSF